MNLSYEELKRRQSLPLSEKIEMSQCVIEQWWKHWDEQVYVCFSGGKDSTVLLHLVRSLFPDIPAVFSDTGLEYPEIKEFVRTVGNVTWIKPKMSYRQVIDKYGYPIVSKENAQKISEARTTRSSKLFRKRLVGDDNKYKSGKIPNKWQYLIDAPFEISHKCCHVLKKSPFLVHEKKSNRKPFVGLMAGDSHARRQQYIRQGHCNSFTGKVQSIPLAFWTEEDVWEYIKQFNLPYSKIYDMGADRTGCMWCMFGVHMEKEPNRFQRMKITHPKIWNYAINKMGLREVLDYIDVPYE